MKTQQLLNKINNEDYELSRKEALEIASTALKEFSKRSLLAKEVERAMWNVVLAGGCKYDLIAKTELLVKKYN